jgi:hypothetical protein
MLLQMNANLEYPNGTIANVDTGSWLHHAAIMRTGPGVFDGNCNTKPRDLFFSSGNERTNVIFHDVNRTPSSGFYLAPTDRFTLTSELVNLDVEPKNVWLTFTYEFVPGKRAGWQNIKAVWLSLGLTCGADANEGGGVTPPNEMRFTLESPEWRSLWDGDLFTVGMNTRSSLPEYWRRLVNALLGRRPCARRRTQCPGLP